MPVRQHKAVAIRPLRVRRIVLHQLVKQQIGNRRAAQRGAGMAAFGLLHRIHGKQPQRIDRQCRRVRDPLELGVIRVASTSFHSMSQKHAE